MMDKMYGMSLPLPEDIEKKKWAGDISGAMAAIEARLENPDLPQMLRARLLAEKERLPILLSQYPYPRAQAEEKLRELVPDLGPGEFDRLEAQGMVDFLYLNGEKRYFVRFHRSLVNGLPSLAARTLNPPKAENPFLDEMIARMKRDGRLAKKIRLRCVTSLCDEAFLTGQTYLVHLPIPALCAQQREIKLMNYDPMPVLIGPENAEQRTIAFREKLSLNRSFQVEYEYIQETAYVDLMNGPRPAAPIYPSEPPPTPEDVAAQEPQILFTPYLKSLAAELAGGKTEPVAIARSFYDFITTKVTYAFVRDYLQLDRLAEYCALHLKGDCGLQALLFIVLCRIAGIPARWQSGLSIDKDGAGAHDWAQFYVEPYGWLFCDCSFGGSAWRAGSKERWDFYFGNLEPMRMVANRVFEAPLQPEKQFLRADPYDNQAGEVECESRFFSLREAYADTSVLSVEDWEPA